MNATLAGPPGPAQSSEGAFQAMQQAAGRARLRLDVRAALVESPDPRIKVAARPHEMQRRLGQLLQETGVALRRLAEASRGLPRLQGGQFASFHRALGQQPGDEDRKSTSLTSSHYCAS